MRALLISGSHVSTTQKKTPYQSCAEVPSQAFVYVFVLFGL